MNKEQKELFEKLLSTVDENNKHRVYDEIVKTVDPYCRFCAGCHAKISTHNE